MTRRGFTIVELVITITIMGVLMILAVVNVNASQVRARDDERKADIGSITSALESFYTVGYNDSTNYSRYPATDMVASETTIRAQLRDISMDSVTAPGADSVTESFVAATNAVQTASGVLPQPSTSQYIYQPLTAAGTLCTTNGAECRKFNLYYRLEHDSIIYQVTSRNQ